MLIAIGFWVYGSFIMFAYGVALLRVVARARRLHHINIKPVMPFVVVGLGVTAWLSSLFSFVLKVGFIVHVVILLGALFIAIYLRREIMDLLIAGLQKKNLVVWFITALGLIVVLIYAVKIPSNPDTVLYHAQAIHWAEEYPVAPGLGHLDPRLGAGSNWFVLNALFSFSFLHLQSFHLVPSLFVLVCLIYFINGVGNLLAGDVHVSQVARMLFVPILIYIVLNEVSSPGTDLPVILVYWMILCLWLETLKDQDTSYLQTIIFFLSVSVVTFKMSGAAVVLIALWIIAVHIRNRDYRSLLIHASMAAIVLVPWLVRNFILSGYWLYPEPWMRFVSPSVDWAMSVERVASFKAGVQAWAISPGLRPDDLANLSWMDQQQLWFSNLTRNQKGIVILSACSPLLFWMAVIFHPSSRKIANRYLGFVVVSYLCIIFWLFTAPSIRFGYGYLLGVIVIAVTPFVTGMLNDMGRYRIYPIFVIVLLIVFQLVSAILTSPADGTRYSALLIIPSDYHHVPSTACDMGDISIQCAQSWRRCSYDAFPCVPVPLKNIEMRGGTFADGFRLMDSMDD